jgi:hypothetical protein
MSREKKYICQKSSAIPKNYYIKKIIIANFMQTK